MRKAAESTLPSSSAQSPTQYFRDGEDAAERVYSYWVVGIYRIYGRESCGRFSCDGLKSSL